MSLDLICRIFAAMWIFLFLLWLSVTLVGVSQAFEAGVWYGGGAVLTLFGVWSLRFINLREP